MLNFAEQTGSGAIIVVWSFLIVTDTLRFTKHCQYTHHCEEVTRKLGSPSALLKMSNVEGEASSAKSRLQYRRMLNRQSLGELHIRVHNDNRVAFRLLGCCQNAILGVTVSARH
jgi:hypothetical protein